MNEETGRFLGGMFLADGIQFGLYLLQDLHRWDLKREQASMADREEAARLRNDTLRRLGTGELFSAGTALIESLSGAAEPRRVEVAVTESDFVLLDAEDRPPAQRIAHLPREGEEVVARIPRSEVTGVRLLDERGEPVSNPPTELQELEEPDRQYVVWVDRKTTEGSGGHIFVFSAWSVADEARRDFERSMPRTE